MATQCTLKSLSFAPTGRRQVLGRFDGDSVTSDAGGLLLREPDLRIGLARRLKPL